MKEEEYCWPENIEIEIKGERVEKLYTTEEFRNLLEGASKECYNCAVEKYCNGKLPESLLFYITLFDEKFFLDREKNVYKGSSKNIYDLDGAVSVLLRKDGFHRTDIHLSPLATTPHHTIIEIEWSIYGWTNHVLIGNPFFPFPPFIIMGPALPIDYDRNINSKIHLPILDISDL